MSKADPHRLAKAVNKLGVVNMKNNQLILQQVESILTQSQVQNSLKMLCKTKPEGILNEDLLARERMYNIDIQLDSVDLEDSENSEESADSDDIWDWINSEEE